MQASPCLPGPEASKHPVGESSLEEKNTSQQFDFQAFGLQAVVKGTVGGSHTGRVSDDLGRPSACCHPQAGPSIPGKRLAPPSSPRLDAVRTANRTWRRGLLICGSPKHSGGTQGVFLLFPRWFK